MINNTATNTLQYTGLVKLSQYIDSKKTELAQISNQGGFSLFTFFSECLAGDFKTAELYRPVKIRLLKHTIEGTEDIYEGLSKFIFLNTLPEKVYNETHVQTIVRYNFIIPQEVLESGKDFNSIGLYANPVKLDDPGNFSALCHIDSLGNKTSDSVLVVDWELMISNKLTTI